MTDYELIAALCVRIGMIMEDACAEAVTATPAKGPNLDLVVAGLHRASVQIDVLVRAAAQLVASCDSSPDQA